MVLECQEIKMVRSQRLRNFYDNHWGKVTLWGLLDFLEELDQDAVLFRQGELMNSVRHVQRVLGWVEKGVWEFTCTEVVGKEEWGSKILKMRLET